MEGPLARTALVVSLAATLVACAADSLDGSPLWGSFSALELKRLPAGSKVYFRRPVTIPARTGRITILGPTGVTAFATELTLASADVDRVIKTTTPLLVDSIASTGPPGSRGRCDTTLLLRTSGGEAMQLRTGWFGTAGRCSPPTIGDLADITLIVPAPPVPIE